MSSKDKAPKRTKRQKRKQGPVQLVDDFVTDFPKYWKDVPVIQLRLSDEEETYVIER